ncbi:MAG: DNA replication/repair protein RecF [Candidatus Zixiibacteriota bacterium]
MVLETLKITDFRNIATLEINLSPGVNIFYGDNGSGKTNLLEAIFVLYLGRSHRAASESVMVREGCEFYRLEGTANQFDKNYELAVAYERGGRKRVSIDKVAVRLSELYDNFSAVAVGPEDSEILAGSPSVRRRFLDIYLSQFSQKYLSSLAAYQKVIAQKNAALKRHMDPFAFNELLVESGASIMRDRIDFLAKVAESAAQYYGHISDGGMLRVGYQPSVSLPQPTESKDDIKKAFAAALQKAAERERIIETAMVGPHRDDIIFDINDLPARSHGSQGEWRTAAIALKLAVYHLIKEKRGFHPVLLLDEIFAELDHKRAELLVAAFEDFRQLFLTTAVEPPGFLRQNSCGYRVAGGKIIEV